MPFTKIVPADLDSPCRELSNGGLGIAVAFLVCRQIMFLSAHIGRPNQLYFYRASTVHTRSLLPRTPVYPE